MEISENNLDLIYDYSEKHVKRLQDSINSVNTRLSWVIGFSGLLLRFSFDLHTMLLQVVMSGCAVAAVVCCVAALLPRSAGKLASPETLLQDYFGETEERCKIYIAKGFAQTAESLNRLRGWRVRCLAAALTLALLSLLALAVDSFQAALA